MEEENKFYHNVGNTLRKLREEYRGKMTQADLAELLAVAPNTVSRWETGTYKPSLFMMARIEEILGAGLYLPAFLPSNNNHK